MGLDFKIINQKICPWRQRIWQEKLANIVHSMDNLQVHHKVKNTHVVFKWISGKRKNERRDGDAWAKE